MRLELVGWRLVGPVGRLVGHVRVVVCVLFETAALGRAGQSIGSA